MENDFYVGDGFRTNPLSLVPGGYDVKIFFSDKDPLVYSKIKNPDAYFRSLGDPTIVDYKIIGESKI